MTSLVAGLALGIILLIVATVVAVARRPDVFDRIIGVGVVGTKTTVLLAYTGLLFGRVDAFVDIALTYALLSFVVTLAAARYVTWKAET